MIYFSSDRHLMHQNVLTFDVKRGEKFNSIEEHDDWILEQLSSLSKNDDIYFLGDLIRKLDKQSLYIYKERLSKINARMYRILGNHDYKPIRKIFSDMFESVGYYGKVKYNKRKIILSHYPYLTRAGMHLDPPVIHLHGHTHQKELPVQNDNRICVSYAGDKLLWSIDEILREI